MLTTKTNEGSSQPSDLNIRAKRQQRDLIVQAAELLGKTRSDFRMETACREAEEVLLDQRVFALDAEAFKKFQAFLDEPPSENPKLHQSYDVVSQNPCSENIKITWKINRG